MRDKEIKQLAVEELAKINLIDSSDVLDPLVENEPRTIPNHFLSRLSKNSKFWEAMCLASRHEGNSFSLYILNIPNDTSPEAALALTEGRRVTLSRPISGL